MAEISTFFVFEAPAAEVEALLTDHVVGAEPRFGASPAWLHAPRSGVTVLTLDELAVFDDKWEQQTFAGGKALQIAAALARALQARTWHVNVRSAVTDECAVHAFDASGNKRWTRTCRPNDLKEQIIAAGLGHPDSPTLTDAQRDTQAAFVKTAFRIPLSAMEQEVGVRVFDWGKMELGANAGEPRELLLGGERALGVKTTADTRAFAQAMQSPEAEADAEQLLEGMSFESLAPRLALTPATRKKAKVKKSASTAASAEKAAPSLKLSAKSPRPRKATASAAKARKPTKASAEKKLAKSKAVPAATTKPAPPKKPVRPPKSAQGKKKRR